MITLPGTIHLSRYFLVLYICLDTSWYDTVTAENIFESNYYRIEFLRDVELYNG
jgi:hypothetical protein